MADGLPDGCRETDDVDDPRSGYFVRHEVELVLATLLVPKRYLNENIG